MAAKTFYLDALGQGLSETPDPVATCSTGWIVSTGATLHSSMASGVKRAASTFVGTTDPDGTPDTTLVDYMETLSYTGNFDAGNWDFHFVVRAVTVGGAQDGRIRFRLFKFDSFAGIFTEITSGHQLASIVLNVATTADSDSTLTIAVPAFSLANEEIVLQVAWERTGAGGMTTSDIMFRTGSSATVGSRITTANFTAVTANQIDIAGTVAGSGTPAGSAAARLAVSGQISSTGSPAGSIVSKSGVQGAVTANGLAAATVQTVLAMIGAVQGQGSSAGALSTVTPLAGQVNGSGVLTGVLVRLEPLQGQVSGSGLTAGALNARLALIGSVTGIGIAVAAFEEAGGFITGAVIGVGSLAGTLTTRFPLAGAVGGSSSAAARIDTRIGLTGESDGTALADGNMNTVIGLIGESDGAALATSDLNAVLTLLGQVMAVSDLTGDLDKISGVVIEIPPCPSGVVLENSRTGVMLTNSLSGCELEDSRTGADLICLTPEEEEALING